MATIQDRPERDERAHQRADATAAREVDPLAPELRRLIVGYRVSQALFVAARLGIADLLGDETLSVDELARLTGTHPPSLYRIMRLIAGEGVFEEIGDRHFRMTPLAAALRRDAPGSLRIRAIFEAEECNWRAWNNIMHSVQTGATAFDDEFGMGFFDYVKKNPETAAIFDELMATQTLPWAHAVADAYDFSGVETLVDVGGGYGALLTTIMRVHPSMRGILFDLDHVIEAAGPKLEAMPDIAGRCRTVGGDFFQTVPAGGDCYLLKYILHDWDDERSKTILRNCRRAMPPRNGRLLIVELLIPPGNAPDYAKLVDVDMLVKTGGRERTEQEHRELLAAAGFSLSRVLTTRAEISVIEALPG